MPWSNLVQIAQGFGGDTSYPLRIGAYKVSHRFKTWNNQYINYVEEREYRSREFLFELYIFVVDDHWRL